ncbi:DNA polymerase IV [Cellulomonas sp. URHE0023]|uniref:DNA polymerase Y family protein n=1 Tax=Cellulomonas sp. URHE0023 TaxID=1380354 RepID=UPI000A65E189|nr:DNA polymerase IV [Cellulomonas sp. URHE0023]
MSRAPRSAQTRRDWGRGEDSCSILHVELDEFFVSVELARRPQLRGLPVIVGRAPGGVVLSASYEARAFGVDSDMPMSTALRQCPQAIVVPPDHHVYREVSTGVMRLLGDVTVLVEQVGAGEAFLDVAGARRRLGPPIEIAAVVRRRVHEQYGITCSVGIGSTKLVARLASGRAKPDGVLLIPRRAAVDFVRSHPLSALKGVDGGIEEALSRWGIHTVAELADSDVTVVHRAVGRVAGAHLVDLSWGRDPRPVLPRRTETSVSAEETLVGHVADLGVVQAVTRDLADLCAGRLRARGLATRSVSVQVRTSDFRSLSRSRTLLTPTDAGRELYLAARELIAGVDLGGLSVRRVVLSVDGLTEVVQTIRHPTLDDAVGEPERDGRVPGLKSTWFEAV